MRKGQRKEIKERNKKKNINIRRERERGGEELQKETDGKRRGILIIKVCLINYLRSYHPIYKIGSSKQVRTLCLAKRYDYYLIDKTLFQTNR